MTAEIEVDVIVHNECWLETLPSIEENTLSICQQALRFTGITAHLEQLELSVTLADDAHVQMLNKQYRQKDKPTNVLSFPNSSLTPPDFEDIDDYEGYLLLGDIVLSLETLEKEAQEQGKSLQAHFTHLLVHGLLHLLGYDHETEEEAVIMEALETRILAEWGIESPYEQEQA